MIRQILAEGKQVLKKKIAEFDNEQDAYIYEWALINLFHEHVTNMRAGGGGKFKLEVKETPINLSDASEILGISRKELRKMVWRGELGYTNSQGTFFSPSELQTYLVSHAVTTDDIPTSPLMTADDILDAEEVGIRLRIHQRTVIRLANQGQLPGFKVGGRWRFKRQDIEDYIEEQKRRYAEKKDD